jgi:hypothetical protein
MAAFAKLAAALSGRLQDYPSLGPTIHAVIVLDAERSPA